MARIDSRQYNGAASKTKSDDIIATIEGRRLIECNLILLLFVYIFINISAVEKYQHFHNVNIIL
jgi:hypothetical protein